MVELPGLPSPLPWRRSARAARFLLRVRPADGEVELVIPRGAPGGPALDFALGNLDWIGERRARARSRLAFRDGMTLPFLGAPHLLAHLPLALGGVWREGATIFVSGRAEHVNRRVGDWLRGEARRAIQPAALAAAARVGRRIRRISIRDTATRWGSCSSGGALSFSWRLILAPAEVLAYVVAHEVAHLREMHHGPAFWRLVELLRPDAATQRDWLRRHGTELQRYG
ncbi:MAG: DUF45 domain-containing protein [Alphaproteobacteria bacterium]|nr:DUF45 domain-containing protein [Alphaproteobacteria bacterium]